jgi:CheY-like chemotaxis protein
VRQRDEHADQHHYATQHGGHREGSVVPVVVAVSVIVRVSVVIKVIAGVVAFLGVVLVVIIVVDIELERVQRRDTEIAGAAVTDPGIAHFHFFEVVLVDLDFDVTFRAGRHTLSSETAIIAKLILIVHRDRNVRDRFAAALTDARHTYVMSATAAEALAAGDRRDPAVSLALLDLGISDDPVALIGELRRRTHAALPVLVFAGSVRSAADTRALLQAAVAGYISEHAATSQILPALAPHLFPASFDRRLSPRVVLGVPVSYRSGNTIAAATTLNVSRSGLAIRTLTPLAAGAPISVKLRLPGAPAEIERAGRVIWANQRVGMGVQVDEEIDP